MRKLLRRRSNWVSVLALALSVTTFVLWVSSAFVRTIVLVRRPCELYSNSDGITCSMLPRNYAQLLTGNMRIGGAGFLVGGFARFHFDNGQTGLLITVQHWFVVACTAFIGFPTARYLVHALRKRRETSSEK